MSRKTKPSTRKKPKNANSTDDSRKQGRPDEFFTTAQDAAIVATFPTHDAWVLERIESLTSTSHEYLAEKRRLAAALLDTPTFEGCVVEGDQNRSQNTCISRIVRKYSGRFRALFKNKEEPHTESTIPPELAGPLAKAWLRVIGQLTGRHMFVEENAELIKETEEQLLQEGCTAARGGGIRNKAIAIAWAKCPDKETWEERAKDLTTHMEEFREYFPEMFQEAQAGVLARGVLGTIAIKSYISVRAESGDITTTIAHAAFDGYASERIYMEPEALHQGESEWNRIVDAFLPRPPQTPQPTDIPVNEHGVPIWPASIDMLEASGRQLSDTLAHLIAALWGYLHQDVVPFPPFPEEDIDANPNKYYDTSLFQLPCKLGAEKASEISALAEYFAAQSKTPHPFQFHLSADTLAKEPVGLTGANPEDDSNPGDVSLVSPNGNISLAPIDPNLNPNPTPDSLAGTNETGEHPGTTKQRKGPKKTSAATKTGAPTKRTKKKRDLQDADTESAPPPKKVKKAAPGGENASAAASTPGSSRGLRNRTVPRAPQQSVSAPQPSNKRIPASKRWAYSDEPRPVTPPPLPM